VDARDPLRATRFRSSSFDLDYFKRVNDSHGHQAGSQVLHEIGRLLFEDAALHRRAVRYGGDEVRDPHAGDQQGPGGRCAKRIGAEIARQPSSPTSPTARSRSPPASASRRFPDDAAPRSPHPARGRSMYRVKADNRGGVYAAVDARRLPSGLEP